MNKIILLTVFSVLSSIISNTKAAQELQLEMFPPVKLYEVNDPKDFDKAWNGSEMICTVKGYINPDMNKEGQEEGVFKWEVSAPSIVGIQPPEGETPLPIDPRQVFVRLVPLTEGQKLVSLTFSLMVSYTERGIMKQDGDSISFSVLAKEK